MYCTVMVHYDMYCSLKLYLFLVQVFVLVWYGCTVLPSYIHCKFIGDEKIKFFSPILIIGQSVFIRFFIIFVTRTRPSRMWVRLLQAFWLCNVNFVMKNKNKKTNATSWRVKYVSTSTGTVHTWPFMYCSANLSQIQESRKWEYLLKI